MPDHRKKHFYEVKELLFSGLLMFLFNQKTRNNADNTSKNEDYLDNIQRVFAVRVPVMDTVDLFLRKLDATELENIKQDMFRELVKSKVLQKFKFGGEYFMLAIDGTGLQSYNYEPYPGCPFKNHKKSGKTIWTAYVLEAKIIGSNGFSLSLISEWIENPENEEFIKQDCEFEAFKRLAKRLKKNFPRLPLMILLDGLYPKEPIFTICRENNWRYVITLKDKSLKTVQEEVADNLLFNNYETEDYFFANKIFWVKNEYKFFDSIEYKKHDLNILETIVTKEHRKNKEIEEVRFVHVTDIEINKTNVHKLSEAGRFRWKIENEGFNNQKNSDYNMNHKFSRTNFQATKNYYSLLQIADIINQLTYKELFMTNLIKKYDFTLKSVIHKILTYLEGYFFDDVELLQEIKDKKIQLRY